MTDSRHTTELPSSVELKVQNYLEVTSFGVSEHGLRGQAGLGLAPALHGGRGGAPTTYLAACSLPAGCLGGYVPGGTVEPRKAFSELTQAVLSLAATGTGQYVHLPRPHPETRHRLRAPGR